MNPSLITLIINIVLVVFILFGFLGGLKGIKKSTYNLVVFIINLIVVFLITPVVSGAVLKISIDGKTIHDHISVAVQDLVGADTASSPFMKDIISNIPIMVVNLAVTFVSILVLGLILRLISIIFYNY